MKMKRTLATLTLLSALASAPGGLLAAQTGQPQPAPPPQQQSQAAATQENPTPQQPEGERPRPRQTENSAPVAAPPQQTPAVPPATTTTSVRPGPAPSRSAARTAGDDENEAAVQPVYQNYMAQYRLGPEDVVSIYVFGHDRYNRTGIVIPPDGRLYHYLIPEGILVAGKTVEQVQQELTRRLDEYIIEPRVSVMLERAVSARYSVVGDVAQPGVRAMARRLSVYEAVMEAGGVTSTADKTKVMIVRRQADNRLAMIQVNLREIESGRAPDNHFLQPGDQVLVPGSAFRRGLHTLTNLIPLLSFARIFAGGW